MVFLLDLGEGYALYAQKDKLIHDIASKLLAYKLEQGPNTKYAIKVLYIHSPVTVSSTTFSFKIT